MTGRSAVVAASSQGLGFACAAALGASGASVILNGRDVARLAAARDRLHDQGIAVGTVMADLGTESGCRTFVDQWGEPDILVTNNGGPSPRAVRELDAKHLGTALAMNLQMPALLMRAALPGMSRRGFGRIVHITSIAARMHLEDLEASSAARSGLTALSSATARHYARFGVTINCIEPGLFATDRMSALRARGGTTAELAARIPVGRLGIPSELGAVCAFLCSTEAAYLTGQSIRVDGGLNPALS